MADKKPDTVFEYTRNGKEEEFIVVSPSFDEEEESQMVYSQKFNDCIKKGLMPQANFIQTLIKQGAWSQSKEEEISELQDKLRELREELKELWSLEVHKDEDKEKADEVKKEAQEVREQLYQLLIERNNLLQHTAEEKADTVRTNYLTSQCVKLAKKTDKGEYVPDKKVWKSFEEYKKDDDIAFRSICWARFISFMNNLSSLENYFDEDKAHPWERVSDDGEAES